MRFDLSAGLMCCAAILVFLFGCTDEPTATPTSENSTVVAPPSTIEDEPPNDSVSTPNLAEVREEIDEALDAAARYSDEQKNEYVAELEERLDRVDESFEELQQETAQLTEQAKTKWQEELDDVESKRKQLREKLGKLSSASNDAWAKLKTGFEQAWQDLKTSVDEAAENLSG